MDPYNGSTIRCIALPLQGRQCTVLFRGRLAASASGQLTKAAIPCKIWSTHGQDTGLREDAVELLDLLGSRLASHNTTHDRTSDRADVAVQHLPGAFRQACAAKGHMGGPLPKQG